MVSGLGERIRDFRKRRGYSQDKLGISVSVTASAVSAYELGERTPSIEILAKIAKTLGTTIDYLACGESNTTAHVSLEGLKPSDADAIRVLVNSLKNKKGEDF